MITAIKETLPKKLCIVSFIFLWLFTGNRLFRSWWQPMQIEIIRTNKSFITFVLPVVSLSYLVNFTACFFYLEQETFLTYAGKAWFKRRILQAPNQILILVDSNEYVRLIWFKRRIVLPNKIAKRNQRVLNSHSSKHK